MRKNLSLVLAATFPVLLMGTAAYSQSAYFQAMTNLNPIVYLPLQETTQPPIGDVETNLGSLGPTANAVYIHTGTHLSKNSSGATADGDTAVSFGNTAGTDNGGFLAVPTTDPRTSVQSPKFTVECWVNPAQSGNPPGNNFEGIISKSGGNSDGIGGFNNQCGFCLSQNYVAYLDSANMRGFDFHVYNGVGHSGAEAVIPFNAQNGVWYHLVGVYDGTNAWLYIDGTNMLTAGFGYQIPMTGSYVPSTWNALEFGASRDLNGNRYEGSIDEVAIYTNVLTPAQIVNHFNAASSATPYSTTILGDNPYMYYRMDSPGYTAPDPSTYPIATNYGTLPSSFFGLYGTAAQPGIPGPQFSGMLDPNNGNASYGVGINGVGGNNGTTANVPVGYDWTNGTPEFAPDAAPIIITNSFADPNWVLMNPTNNATTSATVNRQPFSFTIWFQGRPQDWNRFQTIVGHTDDGWRLAMNTHGTVRWNPGPGGEVDTPSNYSDGAWHQFVGTYDGTNVLTYIDGVLVVTTTTSGVGNGDGSATFPMIGGDPQYLSWGNAAYPIHDVNRVNSNGNPENRLFSGNVTQFAFFTNVLTAAQIANLYAVANPTNPPYIISQPVTGRINPPPGFLFFGVVAGGTTPLAYQWYYNSSSNYAGATQLTTDNVKYVATTNSQMTVSNLAAADSGYYFVVVTNNYGSVTSSLASLSVNYAPVITSQNPAANFSLFPNQTFTLSVTTTADTNSAVGPAAYQWYANGAVSVGQTASTYPITATPALAGVTFQCIVTNSAGSATSAPVTLTISPFPAALTNSPFGSNVLALNPTAYWPMHETGETPVAAEVETNIGSWGQLANAYYGDWQQTVSAIDGGNLVAGNVGSNLFVLHNFPSAIAGDPDPSVELSGAGRSYLVVPRVSPIIPGTSPAKTTLKPPFTLEAWVKPFVWNYFIVMGEDAGNFNASGVRGGFDLNYSGTQNTFSMTVYNGNGGASSEPKTAAIYPPGVWYHLVTTYDGTNVQIYVNGVPDSMSGANGTNGTYAAFNPNTWDPFTLGCGRGYGNVMQGGLDEVAVYTNLLPASEIQKHYTDGTNAAYSNYKGDVLADNPVLYYRMDAPPYLVPSTNQWPVLTNYGALGVNGMYTPGCLPGAGPGPQADGTPITGLSGNNSLQGNGVSMFADAGFNTQFGPTGKTPFSVAAWMKGNPADAARGWQGLVSRSDGSWRLDLDGNGSAANGNANFNPGPASGSTRDIGNAASPITPNDGDWHYVVGTWDGSNQTVYVDGFVAATFQTNVTINTPQNSEVFIGAYPNNAAYANSATSIANEIGRVFSGNLCEAAFWNGVALSSNQITALYDAAQVAPTIVAQPVSGFANQNAGYTNTVLAGGTPPLTYQWYKNNLPMPLAGQTNLPLGANGSRLILYPISTNDQSFDYFVVITNIYGSVTSSVWSINPVFTVPVFTNNLAVTNFLLYAGGHANLSVLAVGAQPISYRWYSNNVVIPGANGTAYTASNVQPPGATNIYYCVASNFVGVTTSFVAVVDIIAIPSVIPYSDVVMADNAFGFWPMDETNGAVIAFDYAAGNDGIYTNALQGQPGFNPNDTNRTSVQFSTTTIQNSDIYGVPTNVDFSAPSGSNSNFSVECWAKGSAQAVDAGVVTKGYGGGGEQFNLDCGSDGGTPNHSYRFFMRDAGGATHSINSTVNPSDGLWHHLAAVCNETNGWVILYVDGSPVGSNAVSPGSGILSSTRNMTIGARPSNSTTNLNDFQYVGWIQDVAVYGYALSAQQVLNHFNAADIPASVFIQPTNVTIGEFGTAVFTESSIGTPPLGYQWFTNSVAVGNGTNATLVLPNVPFAENNLQVYLQVTNNFGTNYSGVPPQTPVSLTVIQGLAQIFVQPPSEVFVEAGSTLSMGVTAYGTEPLSYQWQVSDTNAVNWTNLTDNARITGSLSNVLTVAQARSTDAGSYQLIIANSYGNVTSSIATVVVGILPVNFNGNGIGWTTNQEAGPFSGTPPFIANNLLALTDGPGNEGRSFFFQYPQYIGAFQASFIYQVSPGGAPGANEADGITFCLQNDPRGASALGGGGGSLGYSGITPSWSLQFNIYPTYNNTGSPNSGYGFQVNGVITPTPYATPVSGSSYVNVGSGDPINVSLTYLSGTVSMVMTDAVAGTSFATTTPVNLPSVLGASTAYVGFTGADGGSAATQTVTNFTFISFVSESITLTASNTVAVTWPGAISGYALLQNHNLATTNWVPVTNADNVVNGLNQVIIPVANTNTFYRLGLLH